ncbi:hypothetical protein [Acetoanaerobium noterae]|uniref:hypothetical protein n=1 Tax=Acetoanaerobium noterae TaxID=745369 RepID=UPI003AB9975F
MYRVDSSITSFKVSYGYDSGIKEYITSILLLISFEINFLILSMVLFEVDLVTADL